MFKKAGENVGSIIKKQVHEEVQETKNELLNKWYGRDADDFMQQLMEKVITGVTLQLPNEFTEKCASKLLKSLQDQKSSFFQLVRNKVPIKKNSRITFLNILADQYLPVLMTSRLQFREYVENEANLIKRVLGTSENYKEYFDIKKKQIKDLLDKHLCSLLVKLAQLYKENIKKIDIEAIKGILKQDSEMAKMEIEALLRNPEYDEKLWAAAELGDLKDCYVCLALGANMHFQNKVAGMKTPLHVAAEKAHYQIVDALLKVDLYEQKADVNAFDKFKRTPLFLAVVYNLDEPHKLHPVVQRLCQANAETNIIQQSHPSLETNWEGWTPLLILSYKYNEDYKNSSLNYFLATMELLLEHGANPDIQIEKTTWTEITRKSMVYGGVRNRLFDYTNLQGVTTLAASQKSSHLQEEKQFVGKYLPIISSVVDKGKQALAKTASGDWVGKTPLHFAALKSLADLTDLLMKYKASPEIEDINGRTPIQYLKHSNPLFEMLKTYGEDFEKTSRHSSDPRPSGSGAVFESS